MPLVDMVPSGKIFQACLTKDLLELEVDTVVLSKELTKLADFCIRTGSSLRELRLSLQVPVLQDSGL